MLTQSGRALLLLLGALMIAVGANAEKKSIDPFGARAAPTSAFAPPTAALAPVIGIKPQITLLPANGIPATWRLR
jgi:hypothetical protein